MLSSHSVPGKYILLDELPLTQSGKTDYRALEKNEERLSLAKENERNMSSQTERELTGYPSID